MTSYRKYDRDVAPKTLVRAGNVRVFLVGIRIVDHAKRLRKTSAWREVDRHAGSGILGYRCLPSAASFPAVTVVLEAGTLPRMFHAINWLQESARFHHQLLPKTVRRYLNGRGIPDTVIDRYTLGWDGKHITIPVENRDGEVLFIKTASPAKDGASRPRTKIAAQSPLELYPWSTMRRQPGRIVICASELECLLLEARGFLAVCSTGGAERFAPEWSAEFRDIPHVYACFNRDPEGQRAAERVQAVVAPARIVRLPEAVGRGGGVAEFFIDQRNTAIDFEALLAAAALDALPGSEDNEEAKKRMRERRDRLKAEVPIARVIGEHTRLRKSGKRLTGACPLHERPNPTLAVYPKENTFRCFGCGAEGDAIKFLELREGLTFGQAIEALEKIRYSDAA